MVENDQGHQEGHHLGALLLVLVQLGIHWYWNPDEEHLVLGLSEEVLLLLVDLGYQNLLQC